MVEETRDLILISPVIRILMFSTHSGKKQGYIEYTNRNSQMPEFSSVSRGSNRQLTKSEWKFKSRSGY